MPDGPDLLLGELFRSIDDRYRLSLPQDWVEVLAAESGECVLVKERLGCLSLWNAIQWRASLESGVDVIRAKIRSGALERRTESVQQLGRLLSTRSRTIPVAGRGRIAVPDSFRGFLGVEPGGEVLIVGAAVCVELWRPQAWNEYLGEHMPEFRQLFARLAE